ncbi:MAG: hypothetical protein F4071_04310, partial [Acidimicrobiaceae bacterium]|nr:hypothetical protein [Acidimicrobiaceae bacterium]
MKLSRPSIRPSRIALHAVMILLVVWSVTPFVWTAQTSIKFTRDVASKTPVLWGYETTANAYRNFWLDSDDVNMWGVLAFVLVIAAIAAALGLIGRRARHGWPWFLGATAVICVALWRFPRFWEANDEYDFLVNSVVVTLL